MPQNKMDELKLRLRGFVEQRQWEKFHTPKNLAMALSVEVSEIVEIFQWLNDGGADELGLEKFAHLKDEIGDVMIYLTNLADKFGIDPISAAFDKIVKNEEKYPAHIVKGRAEKYTYYAKQGGDFSVETIIEKRVGTKSLRLVKGDITQRDVDAIVNAANSHLQHGGGVAGAIVKRGGCEIQRESDKIGYVSVGSAALTGAGKLPCRAVIHAVGPRMGEGDEDNKLRSAALKSLEIAIERGFRSISIPAISSGIFGFPKDRCANILVSNAKAFLEDNQDKALEVIEFCIFDDDTLSYFLNEFKALE
ncbi:appr-1-p processing domain-containing protein [Candidatus Magnetoovum chiemensis]|nr:appr-1-p processing domain-containing protein [Candidatus Magnetoovum chiemensis]